MMPIPTRSRSPHNDIKLFRVDTARRKGTRRIGPRDREDSADAARSEPRADARGPDLVASEHSTPGRRTAAVSTHSVSTNGSPVVLSTSAPRERERINQGLFYLDWLLDHRAEFTLLAMKVLGSDVEGGSTGRRRGSVVAGDFTRYDEHAVSRTGRTSSCIVSAGTSRDAYWRLSLSTARPEWSSRPSQRRPEAESRKP